MNADSTAVFMYCAALDGQFLYFVIHLSENLINAFCEK